MGCPSDLVLKSGGRSLLFEIGSQFSGSSLVLGFFGVPSMDRRLCGGGS